MGRKIREHYAETLLMVGEVGLVHSQRRERRVVHLWRTELQLPDGLHVIRI
jgi:hypothetical protein